MYTYCGFEQVKHLPAAESEVFQSIILITEILRLMVAMCHRLKRYIHLWAQWPKKWRLSVPPILLHGFGVLYLVQKTNERCASLVLLIQNFNMYM